MLRPRTKGDFFFFNDFWVFIAASGLSQVSARGGGLLFIAVLKLLISMALLVVEHGF